MISQIKLFPTKNINPESIYKLQINQLDTRNSYLYIYSKATTKHPVIGTQKKKKMSYKNNFQILNLR